MDYICSVHTLLIDKRIQRQIRFVEVSIRKLNYKKRFDGPGGLAKLSSIVCTFYY